MLKGLMTIISTDLLNNTIPFEIAKKVIEGGTDILQLRHKGFFDKDLLEETKNIANLCRSNSIPFILNDRLDIALLSGADGVHLGQQDLPIHAARALLGPSKIIGATVSNLSEALKAESEGADYLGCGHIYPTMTKIKNGLPLGLSGLSHICRHSSLPVFAVGGINIANIGSIFTTGASGAAVASAICKAENSSQATFLLKKAIHQEKAKRDEKQACLPEVGMEGLAKIKQASVAVVGAGGLGCIVLMYLTGAGVGKIAIIDSDSVESSNLPRQVLYSTRDLGILKAEAAAHHLRQMNPEVTLIPLCARLNEKNAKALLNEYDIVIDASDNALTRQAIDSTGKLCIYGGINSFQGQIAVFSENFRYRDLFPFAAKIDESCTRNGILGPMAGIIGAMQAMEALKFILGMKDSLVGKMCVIDANTWTSSIFYGESSFPIPDIDIQISINEASKQNALWIDIREAHERSFAMPEWINHPSSSLEETMALLPKTDTLILICQRGIRSRDWAKVLRERFNNPKIYSLQDGVNGFVDSYY